MDRVEEFVQEGKSFIYVDLSGLKTVEDFSRQFDLIKPVISKYPEHSLYSITNIADTRFNAQIKDLILDYLKHNKRYLKYSVIIGIDGIKKMMIDILIKLSGRDNISCAFCKENAIEQALRQG